MRSLKDKRIYKGNKLVYGNWYNLFVDGDKRMLFKFSHYDDYLVYDIISYQYETLIYYDEIYQSPCFNFNYSDYYCVEASDDEVLK